MDQAKEDYIEKVSQSEDTIINLAVKLSEKIMFIKLEEHPACFAELVKKALHEVREHPEIKVFVNPLYYSRLLKQKASWKMCCFPGPICSFILTKVFRKEAA